MHRLAIVEKVATLAEIRDHWSMDQVLDANDCLDHQIDLTTWLRGPAPPKTERPRR